MFLVNDQWPRGGSALVFARDVGAGSMASSTAAAEGDYVEEIIVTARPAAELASHFGNPRSGGSPVRIGLPTGGWMSDCDWMPCWFLGAFGVVEVARCAI